MWKIEYTKRFLKELAALPKELQSRIELIVFAELEAENPFELGYINKMKGYKDKYKIRVGDYRIGLTIDKTNQTNLVNSRKTYLFTELESSINLVPAVL